VIIVSTSEPSLAQQGAVLSELDGADWPRQWLMLKGYEDVLSYLDT